MSKIYFFSLCLFIVFSASCSKKEDTNETFLPGTNKDSIMIDILSKASELNKSFTNIAPLPIEDELYDHASIDTGFQNIIKAMEDFNEILEHPGFLLGGSLKSSASSEWKFEGCRQSGPVSYCTWVQDRGEYLYKLIQTNESFAGGSKIYSTYISGTFEGVFYGEAGKDYYLISDWIITYGEYHTIITRYYAPMHEGVYGEPHFCFSYHRGESSSIFTPWGKTTKRNATYNYIIYHWDTGNGHHESISSTIEWEGSLIRTIRSRFCYGQESLMPSYSSSFDFETHRSWWCHFDCNGNSFGCGSH
ncbi:MAG: hypothetical protein ACP5E3_19270 [Bacteroidales bacterium]